MRLFPADIRGFNQWVYETALAYSREFPDEAHHLEPLFASIEGGLDVASRQTKSLHVTASAVVVDEEGSHILLLQHRKLGIWVQPGGHLEKSETPPIAAARELYEETGLRALPQGNSPIDIDLHDIPAHPRKGEPAHHHCDFRYLFRAPRSNPILSRESRASMWVRRGLAVREFTCGRLERVAGKLDRLVPQSKNWGAASAIGNR